MPDSRRVSTWGSKQGLTDRMIIWNKVSMIQEFDDIGTNSDNRYQFTRALAGVQILSDDYELTYWNIYIATVLV